MGLWRLLLYYILFIYLFGSRPALSRLGDGAARQPKVRKEFDLMIYETTSLLYK